jgi:hypothetical protein
MKFSTVLILALAALTMNAVAQRTPKPKTKPVHSEEKESGKKASRMAKEPTKNSTDQELRRVEQSSARVSGARKTEGSKAHNPALKAPKKEANPPIHFASAGGSGKNKSKAGDPLKGRLRHKGSRH